MIAELRKIQLDWQLTAPELSRLSHVPEDRLRGYFSLSPEQLSQLPTVPAGLEPAMPLVGIFRALAKLRPDPEAQQEWLKQPNSILENQVPLQVMMMSPQHLSWVCYTLDSAVRQENL